MSPLSEPPRNLDSFPSLLLPSESLLHRIHRAERGPWWFSSDRMRFDLASPNGTCYLAEDVSGALVEVFQDWIGAILPRSEVDARVVSSLRIPVDVLVADCTHSRALSFGVTAEIHSSPDRGLTQRWAGAIADAGFQGIRYFVRHDPSQQHAAVALFGVAGEAAWPVESSTELSEALLLDVQATFGIRVLRVP